MDIVSAMVAEGLHNMEMTVLFRQGFTWDETDIHNLVDGLMTEVSQHPDFPEYLVLFQHHTKDETLRALGGGQAYTAKQITGVHHKDLPFIPGFAKPHG